jgi:hypothetical protein
MARLLILDQANAYFSKLGALDGAFSLWVLMVILLG